RLQARRHQDWRHARCGRLSRQGWLQARGCQARDAPRRPRRIRCLCRRWRSAVTRVSWLIVATSVGALALPAGRVFTQGDRGLTAVDKKSATPKPTPRTADGRPDLSGYWKGTRDTTPVGNIGKDLPGFKLPLTAAGEAALHHNLTATIDPESLCILGGIPRHNASGLPFEVLQGSKKVAFLYWYTYYRLIPIDANRKHSDDPDPSFFGEELGRWDGDTLVIDSIGFKDERVWIDENANPHSDALHVVER